MTPFSRTVRNSKRNFTDFECDQYADIFANNDDTGVMADVPVGVLFWLQFDPTHNALNSKIVDGEAFNIYSPACDLQGSYAEEGGWLYSGDKFALHESGGLPRFDLGNNNSREVMADFRGNENSFLRRMHLLVCQIHNKLVDDYGYDFEKAKRATIAITNRITLRFTELLCGGNANQRAVERLIALKFHNSLEWNFAAARYAHAMCPAIVQGDDPLVTGRLALDVDIRAMFDGSEMAKTLDPSVSIAMKNMASVPIKKNIIKRTLNRSVEFELPSFGEIARVAGITAHESEENLPIWPGMLAEAQRVNFGQRLGPIGAVLVYAGNYGHIQENAATRDGLWFELDDELPDDMASTLDWLGL